MDPKKEFKKKQLDEINFENFLYYGSKNYKIIPIFSYFYYGYILVLLFCLLISLILVSFSFFLFLIIFLVLIFFMDYIKYKRDFPWKDKLWIHKKKLFKYFRKSVKKGKFGEDRACKELVLNWYKKSKGWSKYRDSLLNQIHFFIIIPILASIIIIFVSLNQIPFYLYFLIFYILFITIMFLIFILFLLSNIESYISRFKYFLNNTLQYYYKTLEDNRNRVLNFTDIKESKNILIKTNQIKSQLFEIQEFHSFNMIKELKLSKYKFNLPYIYKKYQSGKEFDLIFILNDYIDFINFLVNLVKNEYKINIYSVLEGYRLIFEKIRQNIIDNSHRFGFNLRRRRYQGYKDLEENNKLILDSVNMIHVELESLKSQKKPPLVYKKNLEMIFPNYYKNRNIEISNEDLDHLIKLNDEKIKQRLYNILKKNSNIDNITEKKLESEFEKPHTGYEISDFDFVLSTDFSYTNISIVIKSGQEVKKEKITEKEVYYQLIRPSERLTNVLTIYLSAKKSTEALRSRIKEFNDRNLNTFIEVIEDKNFARLFKAYEEL